MKNARKKFSPRRRKKIPKVKAFIEQCLKEGIVTPTEMRDIYAKRYNRERTVECFIMALSRMNMDKNKRDALLIEKQKEEAGRDILEYPQVANYVSAAQVSRIQKRQIDTQLKNLRRLWLLMGQTNPTEWTYQDIIENIKNEIPMKEDDRGRMVFEHPAAVGKLLGAYNTMFPNVLPKGWSTGLTVHAAGELKDYLRFGEFNAYIKNLMDKPELSQEGWGALTCAHVNTAAREGTKLVTGILSLKWENIDYSMKRCKIRDKGGRGNAARLWKNVPLDLFEWLHGFFKLRRFHFQRFGYYPTNERHGAGRCFPITYKQFNSNFHETRKRCGGRIAKDLATMRLHIFRKTHAQWCKKLRVPLELICGDFPNGLFGVGWDNPAIPLKYYMEIEEEEVAEATEKSKSRMIKLGLLGER